MSTFQPSKELKFLLGILKGNNLPDQKLDPNHLITLANDHKIVSRICHNPDLLPQNLRTKFIEEAQQIKINQLRLTQELNRLHDILKEVSFLVIKGPLLSQVLYNDPGERQSKDLDLLIDIRDLDIVLRILQENGYELLSRFETEKQKEAIIKHYHHFELYHEELGVMIELHWNLTAIKHLTIDVKNLFVNSKMVMIGNKEFQSLNENDLIAYLCVHGVFHAYFRLQWLVDVHTILKSRSTEEQYGLFNYLEKEGIADFYLITLAVLEQVLGLEVHQRLKSKYGTSKKLKQLIDICLEEINDNDSYKYGSAKSGGFRNTVRKHRMQYLTGGIVGLIKSIESRNVRPQNWQTYVFPDKLFFLNNLFSRFIWLIGKIGNSNK